MDKLPQPADKALSSNNARSQSVAANAELREIAALYAALLFYLKISTNERKGEIAKLVGLSKVELNHSANKCINDRRLNGTKGDDQSRALKLLSEEIFERAAQAGFEDLLTLRKRIVAETKVAFPKSEKSEEQTGKGRGRS